MNEGVLMKFITVTQYQIYVTLTTFSRS